MSTVHVSGSDATDPSPGASDRGATTATRARSFVSVSSTVRQDTVKAARGEHDLMRATYLAPTRPGSQADLDLDTGTHS